MAECCASSWSCSSAAIVARRGSSGTRCALTPLDRKASSRSCGAASSSFTAGQRVQLSGAANPVTRRPRHGLRVEAKGRRNQIPGMQQQRQTVSMPKVPDDGNPYFIIFVKNRKLSGMWMPLTMVNGGQAANAQLALINSSELGRKLYQSNLTRSIGTAVYRDEKVLKEQAIKYSQGFFTARTELQFGYKVYDRTSPQKSTSGSGVIKVPEKGDVKTPLEKVQGVLTAALDGLRGQVATILPKTVAEPTQSKPK